MFALNDLLSGQLSAGRCVFLKATILDPYDPSGRMGDVQVMGDHNDGISEIV